MEEVNFVREKARKIYSNVKEMPSILGILVSEDWLLYSSLRTAFIITSVFFSSLLLYLNLLGSIIVALLFLPFFFLLDTRKSIVAKTYPEEFVKSEKIDQWVERSFLGFVLFIYAYIILAAALIGLGYGDFIQNPSLPFLFAVQMVFYVGSGAGIALLLNLLEGFIYKRLKLFSNFYVSERIRVRARICVVLNALSKDYDIKTIRKKTSAFKECLNIYNDHLRTKFDFIIRDPDKFYKYVRLTALSSDQKNLAKVKEDLPLLIKLMEQKEDPFEFVRTIRAMIGESENKPCDLYQDIEIEPSQFKKQIKANADLLKFLIIVALTLIGSIILPWMLKSPTT